MRFAAWDAELSALKEKRDGLEHDLQPLYEHREKCKADVAHAQGARQAVFYAIADPFGSPVAQATAAYIGYRMPFLIPVLMQHDESHPEWETAITELQEACMISGYRTDSLPKADAHIKNYWDAAFADANKPEPVPTGSRSRTR